MLSTYYIKDTGLRKIAEGSGTSRSVSILYIVKLLPGRRQVKSTDAHFQHVWVCIPA